jgi:hypothetical protein
MQPDNLSETFVDAMFSGIKSTASALWAGSLEHPWVFAVVGALLVLKVLSMRQRKRR